MSLHRFFLPTALPQDAHAPIALPLAAEDLHHAVTVLRLRAGEELEAVDPGGVVWRARVESATRNALIVTPLDREPAPVIRRPGVVLAQGIAKGEKMDSIVRQTVEVGVDGIVPLLTERCVVRLDARRWSERVERWRRIAKSAAAQAHRVLVPRVDEPAGLDPMGETLARADAMVVLWEDECATSLEEALAPWRGRTEAQVALIVGPEGGLSETEVLRLKAQGAITATLGETILRTETAAVVAVALAIHELGRV